LANAGGGESGAEARGCCRALTAECIACAQHTSVARVCRALGSHLAGCDDHRE
jgi:hypothetical protein